MTIRSAREGELETIARFVASLQPKRESHIVFFGESEADIAAEVLDWGATWFERCQVALFDDELAGFIGLHVDGGDGRGWIYGPFAAPGTWDAVADPLLGRCLADPAVAGHDLELGGDVAHERLAALAARHGFERRTPSLVLEIGRAQAAELGDAAVPPLEPGHHTGFAALHDSLFPGTYYPGARLVEQQAKGEATVLALVERGALTGYAAGRIDATGEGYIDYVGVAEHARGAGRGRRLVASLSRHLAGDARSTVSLSVYEDNAPAVALYGRLGFRTTRAVVGYMRPRAGGR